MRVLPPDPDLHRPPVTVLHVVEALHAGVGRHLTDLIRHSAGVRHEVAAGTERTGWDAADDPVARFAAAGAVVHRVDMRRTPHHPANAAALWRLRRIVATRRPDVVHGHSSIGGALARLASWRAPVVRIYTPHGVHPHRLANDAERFLGRRTDRLVAVSESERDLVAALGFVPPDRIEVVRNGIEASVPSATRDLRAEFGIPAGAPLVASVARLEHQKAPDLFVDAAERLSRVVPGAHFLLVGSGPLDHRVTSLVDAGGLGDRFHRLAHVRDVSHVMAQFDVFVLTSRYEGLPYVILEAMRAGLPVVATDVIGTRDAVVHGVTGVLVTPGDPAAVAEAVRWMLDAPQTAASFGRAGAARVADRFDVAAMGAALDELYLRSTAALASTRR
ncbi:MAG TPA: glycosyltransferase family 4 protein [Acidimicrobiales bacterium]|nr:glycosyltransferase family 4 protein [Acidimicrobiales bacterium]